MTGLDMKIQWETRPCEVDGEFGDFQIWEQWSEVVDGRHISRVYGIVEFKDGVRRVEPTCIKFCDETHEELCEWVKYIEQMKKGGTKNDSD